MENNNAESPTITTPEATKNIEPKVVKEKRKGVVILVIVLSLLFLILGGYIVYTEFFQKQEEQEITQELEEDTDLGVCEVGDEDCEEEDVVVKPKNEYTTFEGEVISAKLPKGWSIVEYFDGDGTESLPDMEMGYKGITAIDVVNPNNKQVFTIQAVSGIGFVGCPNYALFSDDNEAYRFEQQNASEEMGEALNITDYTNTNYIEFEFLGVTFRRIGEKYFYDMNEGNNYFEPPCVEGVLTLEGLYFTDEGGHVYEAYFYGPTDDATSADLLVIDEILGSVKLV